MALLIGMIRWWYQNFLLSCLVTSVTSEVNFKVSKQNIKSLDFQNKNWAWIDVNWADKIWPKNIWNYSECRTSFFFLEFWIASDDGQFWNKITIKNYLKIIVWLDFRHFLERSASLAVFPENVLSLLRGTFLNPAECTGWLIQIWEKMLSIKNVQNKFVLI